MLTETELERRLRAALARALSPGPLLLGYSGGLDSHVLLALLAEFVAEHPGFSLKVVHVHHGLNPLADAWAEHCRATCASLGLDCEVVRVAVRVGPRESLEAKAREARYAALAARLPAGGCLLTAHHQDDQLETLLLALKRGAGPRGLAAMAASQPFAGGELRRPLLPFSRAELQAWAQARELCWIEDDSNQDERFDRNFLRQRVLPLLLARWPSLGATASRSAELCAEQEVLLAELAAEDLARAQRPDGSLCLASLEGLSAPRRHQLLRHWLRGLTGQVPSRQQLLRIWPEVVLAQADARPELHWAAGSLRRFQGRLYQVPVLAPVSAAPLPLPLAQPLSLPAGLGCLTLHQVATGAQLRTPNRDEPVTVRFAAPGGLRLQPLGRAGSRPLKKLWQEYGIPPWQRGRWPLLFFGEQLVAAAGLFVVGEHAGQDGVGLAVDWQPGAQAPGCPPVRA